MKQIIITWKVSWALALTLIIACVHLTSVATAKSLVGSILILPFLPLRLYEALSSPFSFWVGLAFSTHNPDGPTEILLASLGALLAAILLVVGLIDFINSKTRNHF